MDLCETGAVMDILETAYPRYYAGVDRERRKRAAEMWASAFERDDPRLVAAAVKSFIDGDEKGFPPVPGQIRAKMRLIVGRGEMTEGEAWSLVFRAIGNSGYFAAEEFAKLPAQIQNALGGVERGTALLREWALVDTKTLQSVVASNFQRSYREAAAREREFAKLPPDIQALALQIAGAMAMPAPEGGGKNG